MDVTALITWVLTAGGGFVLLGIWLSRGRTREGGASRIGPTFIFSHFLLAAAGLVIWLAYVLGVDAPALPLVALLILLAVAALGFTMFARWLADRGREPRPTTPEQHFPVVVVALHGLLGAVTLILVALVAFGVA